MKICPFCKNENFNNEDDCERCNKSIQNINHERFRFQDHILKTFSIVAVYIVFLKGVVFLESAAPPNTPTILFQVIRITATSAIIIVLLSTVFSSYLYVNLRRKTNETSELGHFLVYLGFNIVFFLGIITFVALPDKNGITLLPSLLLFIAFPASVIALTNYNLNNKQKIISWAYVLSIWCLEIFLIGYYSILIFAKYNLSPDLWWGIEIAFFSLLFFFFGVFIGGIVALSIAPPFSFFGVVNYLFYSDPKDILLEIALYGAIYVALISPAIWRIINYLAS